MQQPMLAQSSSHIHQPAYLRKRQRRPKRANVDSHHHAERQQPPQQYPVHHQVAQPRNDLVAFRQFYDAQLKTLTFNSRQIIQDLSQTALKYSHLSAIVVDSLESHIRHASLPEKLPAFYLLDSIAKNGFDPYALQLIPRIGSIFLDTHRVVDADTRSKMEAMLVTWRTGAPNGRELFGMNVQSNIERTLWGSKPTFQQHPNRAQVLVKLDSSLAERERALAWDPNAVTQVGALRQLKTMVQSSELSPIDLSAIMGQLRSMPPVSQPLLAISQVAPVFVPSPMPAPVVPSVDPTLLSSINGLYNSLMKAGVLASLPTPTVQEPKPVDPKKDYERAILGMKIDLSTFTLTRTRPQIVSGMCEGQQCKQCSIRFPNTEHGSQRMADHLDMHFRQNRKMEQHGRGHSRSWFVGAESFAREAHSVNGKGKGSEQGNIASSAEREAELKRSFVVVPVGQEAQTVVCPVCKEQLQAQFNEDDEDWVWNNAVSISGKIFHATCHAEVTSSRALAVIEKLRTESRSRSNTPNEQSPVRKSAPLPPVAGVKRSAAEALDEDTPAVSRVDQPLLKKRA